MEVAQIVLVRCIEVVASRSVAEQTVAARHTEANHTTQQPWFDFESMESIFNQRTPQTSWLHKRSKQ